MRNMFSDVDIRSRINTDGEEPEELTEKEKAIRRIGPEIYWSRCFECKVLSNADEYLAVDFEPKADLEYHSSIIWRETHDRGRFFCKDCHEKVHAIEDAEIQRRVAAGEMEDPALKKPDDEWPVMPGLTRNPNG